MSNSLNLSTVAKPFSLISGGFSNLFGNRDYSSLIKLMGLQMEALQIMDGKLDIIYLQINQVYQILEDLKEELQGLPENTATKIFATQLTGTLITFQNELKAYKKKSIENPIDEKYYTSTFEKCFDFIVDRKASLMVSGNYYNLPLICSCIFFEVLCGSLTGRPKESLDESLLNYKEWITNRLSELDNAIMISRQALTKIFSDAKSKTLYSGCTGEINEEYYWENGEIFVKKIFHINYLFGKYFLKSVAVGNIQDYDIQELLTQHYISEQEIPSQFQCELIGSSKANYIAFKTNSTDLETSAKINFDDGSDVLIVRKNLLSYPSCTVDPIGKNKLQHDTEVMTLSQDLSRQSHNILGIASLQKIAKDSLGFIEIILSEPEISPSEIEKMGFMIQIQQRKAAQWVAFLEANKNFVIEETQRKQLEILQQKMATLQKQAKANFEGYSKLERDILENLPKDLISLFFDSLLEGTKEIEKVIKNISKEAEKLGQDLGENLVKAVNDIADNLEKAPQDLTELFVSLEHFAENQVNSTLQIFDEAEKRIRQGKIVDAVWHVCMDPYRKSEENFAEMVQESTLANSLVSSVLTIYLPVYGAALYSAWYTYRLTGNLEMALKTGTITFLTSQGLTAAAKIPDVTQRVLAGSMVGAAAIAASGGSEKDILEGFVKGAGMNIANEIYRDTTKLDIEGKPPTKMEPYNKEELLKDKSMTFFNKKGQVVVDITKLSREVTHVGIAEVSAGIVSENSWLMKSFANIPYINDMAYFHDQWCAIEGITDGLLTKITIIPATILTIGGSQQPVLEEIIKVMKEKN